MPHPRRLTLDTEAQALTIEWAEGPPSVLPLDALRRACPCATCRAQRESGASLPCGPWRDVQAESVGSYGLRLDWDDGHTDGIFTWKRLRAMGTPA